MIITIDEKEHNTETITGLDSWVELMRMVGQEILKLSIQVEQAKARNRKGKPMPKDKWQKLNEARLGRMREWRMMADHAVFMWPSEFSFTALKINQLLKERDERMYQQLFAIATSNPTHMVLPDYGRPK